MWIIDERLEQNRMASEAELKAKNKAEPVKTYGKHTRK